MELTGVSDADSPDGQRGNAGPFPSPVGQVRARLGERRGRAGNRARPGAEGGGGEQGRLGVCRGRTPRSGLSGLTGVGGEPVRAVAEAGLNAVVGSVDAAAFGGGSLTNLLTDLANIETIGREHHQVVASVASDGAVVPLRLATVYPDDQTVRMLLAEHRSHLAELLQSFSGTQEWGVKVYTELTADASPDDPCAASSGERDGLPGREPRWQKAEACAEEIDRALRGIAIAARRHPVSYLRFEDTDGLMVLNGVYLLDAGRAAEFAGIAQNLVEAHAALGAQVTGPWPPYSFVDRQDA
jgi:hypothetical protein